MTHTDMTGKVTIVTGANSGIGLATAVGLAKMNATVVMICRSKERGEAALADVKKQSGNANVHLLLADLGVQAQVRQVAAEFLSHFDRLDVLINNAAIIPLQREVTADGIETQFAVNHLSYFLLTHLLLDKLKDSAPARIVNVSSNLHAQGKVDFDDLQAVKNYGRFGIPTYNNTKLYNVLFTYELARRLQGTDVTVNCLHPGVIGTRLTRTVPRILHRVYLAIMPGPEVGARTSLYLAAAPEVANVSGKYFVDSQEAPTIPVSHDREVARRLWDVSLEYCGLRETAAVI